MTRPIVLPLLLVLFFLIQNASSSLMAVDLGLSYIKVAVARPGKGLELVTNEQSKRKTPAAVGFTTEGERLFGDAAVAYAAKAPHRVILDGRDLLGECAEGEQSGPLCARRTLNSDALSPFTGEEVVAMLLAMAKRQASAYLGGAPIKDVAVTVPVWYDERQRQAIVDAAKVIGLNCLGVVNANTAAAIKYALDGKAKPTDDAVAAAKARDKKKRTPKTLTQRVLFYDIGASGASASVAEVTSDVKTKVASGVKMLGHAWEKGIGGRMLDAVIVERLADAFDKQRGVGATPSREVPRVMQRLRKEAQKVKEVLSANTEAFVSVASLHEDTDFKTSFMRTDFEKDADSMFSLVAAPAKAVLSEVRLRASDLDAVVPFGGVSRIPRVQSELSKSLGVSTLNKSINTDEAAVMGSVFFAASLSSTFRVRKLEFEDVYTRVITAEVEKEGSSGGFLSGKGKKSTHKVDIFPLGAAKMPSKKTLSLNRNKDFGFEIYLGLDSTGKTRYPERTLYARVKVSGVADVLKKLKDTSKAKTLTPRVALTFLVDKSGFIRIGTAESSVDETVVIEREVEIEEKTNSTNDGKDKDRGTDGANTNSNEKSSNGAENGNDVSAKAEKGSDSSDKKEADESASDDKNGKAKDKKEKKKKTKLEKSTQTVVHRQALKIEYSEGGGLMGTYMSGKELAAAKQVLKDLEKADLERVERADAFNALEGFILGIRSKVRGLDEEDGLYRVSTEEEREKLMQAFEEGEDWMYTDEAKQTANLRKKHFELQKLYEPMETRAKELLGRPEAFKALGDGLNLALEKAEEVRALHVERNSTKVDAFDKFKAFCESAKAWITKKQEAQDKKDPTEEPAVTVKDILEKGVELRKEVDKIAKLEIPPPKISPTASERAGKEEKATKDEASAGESKDNVSSESSSENVNSTAPEAPVDEKEEPSEPDSDGPKVDAASGVSGKDEL